MRAGSQLSQVDARRAAIKAQLEKTIDRTIRVDMRQGATPYFEVELSNIKTRPQKWKLKVESAPGGGCNRFFFRCLSLRFRSADCVVFSAFRSLTMKLLHRQRRACSRC